MWSLIAELQQASIYRYKNTPLKKCTVNYIATLCLKSNLVISLSHVKYRYHFVAYHNERVIAS